MREGYCTTNNSDKKISFFVPCLTDAGFHNWWGGLPMSVYSFLKEYDFGAKTIISFVTHGGSGFLETLDKISELRPGAHVSVNTLSLSRNDVADGKEEVREFGIEAHEEYEISPELEDYFLYEQFGEQIENDTAGMFLPEGGYVYLEEGQSMEEILQDEETENMTLGGM